MTISPRNHDRRHETGVGRAPGRNTPQSEENLRDASLPARGLTQAEADEFIAQLPAVRHERELKIKLELSVTDIGLSEAHSNLLIDKGIFTVGDLLNRKESELRALGRIGDGAMRDIRECLKILGFQSRQSSKRAKDSRT
jgi:hypothetical protein